MEKGDGTEERERKEEKAIDKEEKKQEEQQTIQSVVNPTENEIKEHMLGGKDFLHMKFAKEFPDGRVHHARITHYYAELTEQTSSALWGVLYEGGDSEDVNYEELIKGIKLFAEQSTITTTSGSKCMHLDKEETMELQLDSIQGILKEMVDFFRCPITLDLAVYPVGLPNSAKFYEHGAICEFFAKRGASPNRLVRSPENNSLIPGTYYHIGEQYRIMLLRLASTGLFDADVDLHKWMAIDTLKKKASNNDIVRVPG